MDTMTGRKIDALICPETHQKLTPVSGELLEQLNRRIHERSLTTRSGETISSTAEAALVTEDRQRVYLIRQGIALLLADEAVSLQPDPLQP